MYLDPLTDVGSEALGIFFLLALVFVVGLVYFLPTIYAFPRHPGEGMGRVGIVFVLNLFLGWTLVGYLVAFAIATSRRRRTVAAPPAAEPPIEPTGNDFG